MPDARVSCAAHGSMFSKILASELANASGGMKIRVARCATGRSCPGLFDTEPIKKVHGERSQRLDGVRDRFRVPGSTAREERAEVSHIRSPSATVKRKSPSDGNRGNPAGGRGVTGREERRISGGKRSSRGERDCDFQTELLLPVYVVLATP